jgi:hypothetical protein
MLPRVARSVDGRALIVLAAGICTTALALLGVRLADTTGEHLMAEYVLVFGFVPVPCGAFGVGLVASIGYGAASFITERKITGRLLLAMMALLIASYFIAQYIEYRLAIAELDGDAISFFAYYDYLTRFMSWGSGPVGDVGYVVRATELAGFVAGGLAAPAGLRYRPYCDACRCYRRSKTIAVVPIGADESDAHRRLQSILRAARAGSADELSQTIATYVPAVGRREIAQLPSWLSARVVYCSSCANGVLVTMSHQRATDRRAQPIEVVTEMVPLGAGVVRQLVDGRRGSTHPYR